MRISIGRTRRTHDEEPDQAHVGWLELYFDLVFVVSFIQLGNVLAEDVSWHGAARFAAVFVLLSWAWLGTTVYFGRFFANDAWHRTLVFAQMLTVANMAVLVDGAFDEHVQGFLLSFVANQFILVIMYLRAYRSLGEDRSAIARVATVIGSSAVVILISAFVPPPWRYGLWLVGFLITFNPPILRHYMAFGGRLEVPQKYLSERLGLFTIIVLGESFIKTVSALSEQPLLLPFPISEVFGGLCFIVAASMWWTYFDDVAKARLKPGLMNLQIVLYAHLPLTMGITAFGVSTKKLVLLEMGSPIPVPYLWLTALSVSITMLAVAVIDSVPRTDDDPARAVARVWPRVISAIALLAIAGFGTGLPAEISLSLVAAVCVAQILLESYQLRRYGPAAQ
jgi:low temperature requirement protein LtrA